ncbi:hypothetical protein Tco_0512779, partial [Tanacetum coccineum]
RFQELALMCGRMFPEESDEVEKYVGGLPNMYRISTKGRKTKPNWTKPSTETERAEKSKVKVKKSTRKSTPRS